MAKPKEEVSIILPKGQIFVLFVQTVTAIGLMMGAWFFSGMVENVEGLRSQVAHVQTDIALLKVMQMDITALQKKLDNQTEITSNLSKQIAVLKEQMKNIKLRMELTKKR